MGIAKKVAYNTFVQVIGRGTSIVLSLILIKYLTSYLSVSGYGQYVTAINYAGIFAIIADFGLSTIVVRELAKREDDIKNYLGNVLGLRATLALVTMILAALIALFFPYARELKIGILVVSLANYWISLTQVFVGVFQANMRIDKAVIGDIAGRVVIFITTLFMIYLRLDLTAILGAIFVGNLVTLLISWFLVRDYVKPSLRFNKILWERLFTEMLPMGTVLVLGMIYFRSDMVILSLMKGNEATGIYGVAYKFVDILIALPQFFMGAVFPFIAKYYLKDDRKFKEIMQKAIEILVIAALPITAVLCILAPSLIRFVSSSEFSAAALPLQILSLGIMCSFLAQMPNSVLVATKNQTALIWIYMFLIAENVTLNILFIPKYSYLAAAVITVITEIIGLGANWYLLRRRTNFIPHFKILGKVLISTFMMAVCLYVFRDKLVFALLTGGLTYMVFILALGVVSGEQLISVFSSKSS